MIGTAIETGPATANAPRTNKGTTGRGATKDETARETAKRGCPTTKQGTTKQGRPLRETAPETARSTPRTVVLEATTRRVPSETARQDAPTPPPLQKLNIRGRRTPELRGDRAVAPIQCAPDHRRAPNRSIRNVGRPRAAHLRTGHRAPQAAPDKIATPVLPTPP